MGYYQENLSRDLHHQNAWKRTIPTIPFNDFADPDSENLCTTLRIVNNILDRYCLAWAARQVHLTQNSMRNHIQGPQRAAKTKWERTTNYFPTRTQEKAFRLQLRSHFTRPSKKNTKVEFLFKLERNQRFGQLENQLTIDNQVQVCLDDLKVRISLSYFRLLLQSDWGEDIQEISKNTCWIIL